MGKPFSQELELLFSTYSWAKSQNIEPLEVLKHDIYTPVLVVGSGGSLSACYIAVNLLQQMGIVAKAITPLELHYSKNTLRQSRIIFISAGGRNNDILLSFKTAIEQSPLSVVTVCMRKGAPLTLLGKKYSVSKGLEYAIPAGKDGFLATNSLIAYFTLFLKAFHDDAFILEHNGEGAKELNEVEAFTKKLAVDSTTSILFGGWGHPVAIDIESKFTEAALGNVNIADYRNFAHGRHHWFAKRAKNSSIVAVVTPDEELLASKTLDLMPASIPKLIIRSKLKTPVASLELLIKSFTLIESVGRRRKIDPGKPGVPEFGRKLYNLRYSSLIKSDKVKNQIDKDSINSILGKAKVNTIESLTPEKFSYWFDAYKTFTTKLSETKFGTVVFDYDGTLCSHQARFKPLSEEIKALLNSILKSGFILGIITGRGKSARKEMQAAIAEKFWNNVTIGYYNGSDIGNLSDDSLPNTEIGFDDELQRLYGVLSNYDFSIKLKIELRPKQLSIQIDNVWEWKRIRPSILQLIMKSNCSGIQVLESSHSLDIIKRPDVSKLNILSHCVDKARLSKLSTNCLCIGDRGQWPGNDFELLSTPYSLSVDEVSSDKDSCWNLSPVGMNGVDSTIFYLERIQPFKRYFRFNYEK